MGRIYRLCKKGLTPITILVVPHNNLKSLNLRIPVMGIVLVAFFLVAGAIQISMLVVHGLQYSSLVEKVDFYAKQFSQWNSTVTALHEAERDFRRIFSLDSKDKVLETLDTSYSGSVDMQTLMEELQKTVETVDEIKDYLRRQKDLYLAVPKGYPVKGNVSSPFGRRENPFTGEMSFHSGMDISASPGVPIRATADGIVSHAGWTAHSGYLVVIEHGCGFTTVYAHNKKNAVKAGETVNRGETIGYVGSTGKSTGPHVHYEVWEKGKSVNPKKFLQGRS